MDVTSALRGDTFRPFATLVAPGALGLAPWCALLYIASSDGREFWNGHPIALGVALFIGSIASGLVFENIGARIEHHLDQRIARSQPDHLQIWHRYLLLTLLPEPVGQRYLRTVLFRMKFELAFLGSLPVQLAGWLWLTSEKSAPVLSSIGTIVVAALLGWWFYKEAFDSAKNLADIRRRLVARFDEPAA